MVCLEETPTALVMLLIVETSGHDGIGTTGVFDNGVCGRIPALGIESSMAVKGLIAHEESMGDNLGRCVRRYAANTWLQGAGNGTAAVAACCSTRQYPYSQHQYPSHRRPNLYSNVHKRL